MTNSVLVPPPPRISLVDERGNITRPWSIYLQDVFGRLGGTVAPSNDELNESIEAIQDFASALNLGVFGRQIAELDSPPDIGYVDAFARRAQYVESPPDDASAVICARVFAVRN